MEPERWAEAVELFYTARERSGGERRILLESRCGDNRSLLMVIEQMLRDDESSGSFLERPATAGLASAPSRSVPAAPAARFGRYKIVASVGRGGMGEVWAARDTELDRLVALKFLAPEVLFGREEHLIHEARTASALNHPNIVTVHEVIRHEDTPIIVMELVEGDALRTVCGIAQPVDRVIRLGEQIARALAAAHNAGLTHGDIKPENILVRKDGYIKVVDFGLARWVALEPGTTGSGLVAGTPRYVSPEQAHGDSISPASDIFSFGLVLYELAAGRHAFPSDSPLGAMEGILNREPAAPKSINPEIPATLDHLILSMVTKDPAARPSSEQVAQTLSDLQRVPGILVASSTAAKLAIWLGVCALITGMGFAVWRLGLVAPRGKEPVFSQVTTLVPENRATAAAISPDGQSTAYANVDGIFLRANRNGDIKPLRAPADFIADRLAWFADGAKLVASGFSPATNVPAIWTISITGGVPVLLRTHAGHGIPSPDGTHIAFISEGRSEIWSMGTSGESPRKIISALEDVFLLVFWSPDSRRLGFQRRRLWPEAEVPKPAAARSHAWRYESVEWRYESVELASGRIVAEAPNTPMGSAAALPDGRILYVRLDTNSDIAREVWEVKTSLATGAFLGAARKIATLADHDAVLLGLSATTDGSRMMVLKQSDQRTVFVGDFSRLPPRITNIRRLTLDERTSYPHAWTADSRAVIFESNRSGSSDLFKQYVDRRTPETIVATPVTEMLPQLAPDGRTVLYAVRPDDARGEEYRLMRVGVEGGKPEEVPIGGLLDEFRCALAAGKRCVLRTAARGQFYTYYDLDPIRGKGRELARTKWIFGFLGDWDVSPDGTHVALPNHYSREARIRVVSLETKENEPRERELVLPGVTALRGLVWAADGSGWFVSVDTGIGNRLLYVYLDGRMRSLGDIQGWAVPSPDGRRVAFLDRIVATNAWIIERH